MAQNVDTIASYVRFSISKMNDKTVTGTIKGMHGFIDLKKSNIISIAVCIDPASIKTDNENRDKHLKSDDYFAVKTYPSICFQSTSVQKTTSGFMATGKLSMHGISKTVQIPLILNNKELTGTLILDRYDYGIGKKSDFLMGREVLLTINCILN